MFYFLASTAVMTGAVTNKSSGDRLMIKSQLPFYRFYP